MSTGRGLVPVPRRAVRHRPPTLEATYTVLPDPWQDEPDPFRVYDSVPRGPSRVVRGRPPPKPGFLERFDAFIRRWEGALFIWAIKAATLVVAALISLFLPWVLPLTLFGLAVFFAAACCERQWVPITWAMTATVLSMIAFGPDATLRFLDGVDDVLCNVLCDWMTYRVIALVVLVLLVLVPLLGKDAVSTDQKPESGKALDPRGYGRHAIDDFVEKGTYGDAQLASKGELHLALSRRGNENLRFTPKFYE